MALSGLHTISNYSGLLQSFVEKYEGKKSEVHDDGSGIPTIGAGYGGHSRSENGYEKSDRVFLSAFVTTWAS